MPSEPMTPLEIVAMLRRRCSDVRSKLEENAIATREEIQRLWAGSARNPDVGVLGWAICYASLRKLLGRLHALGERAEQEATASAEAMLDALTDTPGSSEIRGSLLLYVYPKSYIGYRYLYERSTELQSLAKSWQSPTSTKEAIVAEFVRVYRLIAWAVTYPAPGLPFDADHPATELPSSSWILALNDDELMQTWQVALNVNVTRLELIDSASGVNRAARFLDLDQISLTSQRFLDAMSVLHGEPADVIAREKSWASQVALHTLISELQTERDQPDAPPGLVS